MNHFILYLGVKCNNDCIMCNIKETEKHNYTNNYDFICSKMKKNAKSKDSIGFTGGEPTVHPDIVKIFEKADKLGYETVSMSTNGIKLADEKFLNDLLKHNLKSVDLTLHGTEEVHDKIVRHKGAFKKVVQGIENLQKNNVEVRIAHVLMKQNINNFKSFADFLLKREIKCLEIFDLNYEGRAQNNFKDLNPSFVEKKKFFYDNFDLLNNFEEVILFNFPRCVLPISVSDNFKIISEFYKKNNYEFEGGLGGDNTHSEKLQIPVCKKCKFSKECFGFLKKSIEIHGKENVNKMLKIDNFI